MTSKRMWIVLVRRVTDGEIDSLPMTRRAGGAKLAIGIGPVPDGHPPGVATAVGADVARSVPLALRAATVKRSVWPISVAVTRYSLVVAPAIAAHPLPLASHRLHAKLNEVGLPAQVPRVAVSVSPAWGDPVIVGSVLFVGTALAAA